MSHDIPFSVHPKMFRDQPFAFMLCCFPMFWPFMFFWWLGAIGTVLMVDKEKATLRKGIISKRTSEVFHRDVRNIKVNQSVMQRILGTGDILISSAGQSDEEIKISGVANPENIKDVINSLRDD